jgi:hypothetical protein
MLADASISHDDVSKAKPPAPRPAIGHTHADRQAEAQQRRRDIPVAGGRRRGGGPARGRRRGGIRARGGGASRGGPPRQGGSPRRGRRCASGTGRADVGAAELAGGGRRRCARVGEERRVGQERCSASERSGAANLRRGAHRGRERRGEAAATTTEEKQRDLGENG